MNPHNPNEIFDALVRHNETMSALLTRITVADPVYQQQNRQRAIIEKALVSLSAGDTLRTRELLKQL